MKRSHEILWFFFHFDHIDAGFEIKIVKAFQMVLFLFLVDSTFLVPQTHA